MKFSQLKIGQLFLYQGNRYTKSGPLQATLEGQTEPQMIMRAAQIEPLEVLTPTLQPKSDADQLKTEIIQALDSYHQAALSLITDNDATVAESQRRLLNEKYQQLLERLN
jgi:DnaJ-domain-containing protein 1